MDRADETLAGRYELSSVLGRGGMGVVYRARDRTLDRIVAVKVLPAALAQVGTLLERFEREARAAAGLNHPNIIAVFDTGADRGARYIVMECVAGESLAQRLRERGRLDGSEAIEIAAQIASALAAAHAAGIVHRDIKPGNVMVQPSGAIKVLDFGIARATTDAALTSTTAILGSAPYMAPEVALGQSADARSDIYSLGCVLYEMLAGRPPFVGDLPVAVMSQQTSATPRPLREFDAAIPAGVELLVMQMLAKRPEDRPQQAASLVAALRASLRAADAPETVTATQRRAPPPVIATPQASTRPRTPPPQRRLPPESFAGRRSLVTLAVAVALIAGAVIAVAIVNASHSGQSSRRSSNAAPARSTSSSGGSTSRSRSASTTQSTTTRSSTRATKSPAKTTTTTPTSSTTATSTTATSTTASSTPGTSTPGTSTTATSTPGTSTPETSTTTSTPTSAGAQATASGSGQPGR